MSMNDALDQPATRVAGGLRAVRLAPLTTARLVACLALAGVFAMAARPSVDTDTWWHLRAGAWMIEHGQILTHDEFSSTRHGQPWINHSWLSQIPLYLLWPVLGFAGTNLATAALAAFAFYLVYRQSEGSAYLKAFALVLGAATAAIYWSARPQMASFVMTAICAYVLHQFRWRQINRLWLLPPLMALWVNLHGGFALGILLLLVTWLGQAVSLLFGQTGPGVVDRKGLVQIAAVGAACLAVVWLNPYGAALYLYPLRTVSIGVLQDFIQEWQSPNFHQRSLQVFIALWLALFAAVGLSRRRLDLTDLGLLAVFTYLALLAARNIPAFALLAVPVITRHAAAGVELLRASHPRLAAVLDPPQGRQLFGLNWALLFLVLAGVAVKSVDAALPATNERFLESRIPLQAVRFIQAHRPEGRLFNAYNWGGYLTWSLYPDYPVFVDGRTDLYDDALLREYLQAALGQPGYSGIFEKYGIGLILIEAGSQLDEYLRLDPQWQPLFRDEVAALYQRRPGSSGVP